MSDVKNRIYPFLAMNSEKPLWSLLSAKALNRAWENEDDKVWESYLSD